MKRSKIKSLFRVRMKSRSTGEMINSTSIMIPFAESSQFGPSSIARALYQTFNESTVDYTPRVLTIHVSRFSTNDKGEPMKNNADINFTELLDLTEYQAPSVYLLKSVIRCGGSAEDGHWINITKGPSKEWYLIDEEHYYPGELKYLLEHVDEVASRDLKHVPLIFTYVKEGLTLTEELTGQKKEPHSPSGGEKATGRWFTKLL